MPIKIASKGEGKGKQVNNRFVSEKARQWYESAIKRKDKGFIAERGSTTTHAEDWSRRRKWDLFMSESEHLAIELIVREFYANFPECNPGHVYVRGIDVPFNAKVINNFYNLP